MRGSDRLLMLGMVLTVLFIGAALLSLVWTPYDVAAIDVAGRWQLPGATHWLGTDQMGRDLLSMVMAGASVSLAVSLLAIGGALILGTAVGLVAAATGGRLDEALMRAGDVVFALPALLLAILLSAVLGPGLLNAVLAIAIFNIPVFARLARNEGRRLWARDFVSAARLAGKGKARISIDHVLPNIAGPIVVQATIQFALALIAEAGLSYVGLGVQPPQPSWGRMLADAQTLIGVAPRLAIVPGLAILLAVFGLTLLGDGLGRRLRGRDRP